MSYTVREEDFDSIRDAWEEVLPLCEADTVFLTPTWQQLWWDHFGDGLELLLLSVREGEDVIGVAPMTRRNGVISLLGDTDLFDYLDFAVTRDHEAAFYDALYEHLVNLEWHTMELPALRQNSPTLRIIPALADKKGFATEVVQRDMSPAASLPDTWDDYLAGLSKKDRHELRRKMRRLERTDHSSQYVCDKVDGLAASMEDFFRLHRASSHEKEAFWTPQRERFFIDMSQELARRGQFKLYFLEVDDLRVACCICFDYGDSYFLYNSGYDPNFSALSVGLINKALTIRDAIDEGRRSFDFLKGTERYKYDLGGEDHAIYSVTVRR